LQFYSYPEFFVDEWKLLLETKSDERAKRKNIHSDANLLDIDVAKSERPKIEATVETSSSLPKPSNSSYQQDARPAMNPKAPEKSIAAPPKATVAPPPPPPVLLYLL
jgi:hypothetical protein